MIQRLFPFLIAALALLGCADPMIGKWQSIEDPDIELEVRDGNEYVEYLADGHTYICNSSDCVFCGVNYQFYAAGTDRYERRGNGDEQCPIKARFSGVYCMLTADTELECTLRDGYIVVYEKIDE